MSLNWYVIRLGLFWPPGPSYMLPLGRILSGRSPIKLMPTTLIVVAAALSLPRENISLEANSSESLGRSGLFRKVREA